jgi:hypothetical protein
MFNGGGARCGAPAPHTNMGHGSVPSYLNATMKELRGERSVHGLNSSHCLLPAGAPGIADSGAPRPHWAMPAECNAAVNAVDRYANRPPNSPLGAHRPFNGPHSNHSPPAAMPPGPGATLAQQQVPQQSRGKQCFDARWPAPSGPLPTGPGGFNSYAPPPTAPFVCERPRTSAGPPLPSQEDRLQPAVSTAPVPPPAGANAAVMTNGFKDSTDFIDAGDESETEFLSSRARPPTRKQRTGGRSRRMRDEVSCMPCLVMC